VSDADLELGQRINLSALISRLFFSSPLFTQNALMPISLGRMTWEEAQLAIQMT
jgi:hypothetical protein